MAVYIFWTSLAVAFYAYMGYPILLLLWRRVAAQPVRKAPIEPAVTLIIAMHNERDNVAAKMQNCFELNYPEDKLQIIVSLDAPTDGTDSLVRDYASRGVEVLSSTVRRGKASAVNRAAAFARGEILVFADARQRFHPNAIRELVANFADSSVGAVSGQLVLLDSDGRESTDTLGIYWRYEKKIRGMESDIHSVPGTTGAIYALRRELFAPIRPRTVLDDVQIPMRAILKGKRVLFEPAAIAYDTVSTTPDIEFEKKRRTLMGNYELLAEMPELLLPWRNPIFLQLLSHKVGRLMVPYCLIALFLSNLFLLHGFYLFTFVCQVMWYALAFTGWLLSARRTPEQATPDSSLKGAETNL
jgi:cellulose synthase/poly-beta-1,6-N-acetylglucosamine synthase-like glycosyltransferase